MRDALRGCSNALFLWKETEKASPGGGEFYLWVSVMDSSELLANYMLARHSQKIASEVPGWEYFRLSLLSVPPVCPPGVKNVSPQANFSELHHLQSQVHGQRTVLAHTWRG